MTTGRLPFTRGGKVDQDRLRKGKLPALFCDKALQSLISSLLTVEETDRLGFGGISDLEGHEFFSNMNWEDITAEVNHLPEAAFITPGESVDKIGLTNFKNANKSNTFPTINDYFWCSFFLK